MNAATNQIRYGNRLIQKKQDSSSLQKHYLSLRRVRPMTGHNMGQKKQPIITINNKKKQMNTQNRFTQIQRENRMLLQKITTIMSKGTISQTLQPRQPSASGMNISFNNYNNNSSSKQMNKTLNGGYRKKQMQSIQYQNAKMLKRLKQKKSSYGVSGLNQDWKKKKAVIKRMSLHPFILNDNLMSTKQSCNQTAQNSIMMRNQNNYTTIQRPLNSFTKQIRKIRKIDGYLFLLTIKFQNNKLFIIGDLRQEQNIKIIQLNKKQAQQFIRQQCDGMLERMFDLLRYDRQTGDLYLVGKDVLEMQQVKNIEQTKQRAVSHHDTRKRIKEQRQYLKKGNSALPPRPLSKQLSRNSNLRKSAPQNKSNPKVNQFINEDHTDNIISMEDQVPKPKVHVTFDENKQKTKNMNVQNIQNQQDQQNVNSDWVKLPNKKTQQNQQQFLQEQELQLQPQINFDTAQQQMNERENFEGEIEENNNL